jgi:hypothetical protein
MQEVAMFGRPRIGVELDNYIVTRDHLALPWYRKPHNEPRWQELLEEYRMTRRISGLLT